MPETGLTKSQRAVWFRCYLAALSSALAQRGKLESREIVGECARIADASVEEIMKRAPSPNLGSLLSGLGR